MKNKKKYNLGMTLPELVLALLMLSAFTGITVMVVEYTSRFFSLLMMKLKKNIFLQIES